MDAETVAQPLDAPQVSRSRVSRALVLIVAVILIPMALNIIFNSWGPLTHESAMRMAFATVAGQTIAILTVVVTLAMTALTRRRSQLPRSSSSPCSCSVRRRRRWAPRPTRSRHA